MNGLHGIIFSYEQEPGLRELAERRMPASIPFGGRYRVVDFMLSNLHAAGITDVGVVLHGNYQSLLDHIGNGKTWDMARKYGGLRILPPFADTRAYRSGEFRGKMEALAGVRSYLQGIRQDYVVLSDSDLIINLPLADVFAAHLESGAELRDYILFKGTRVRDGVTLRYVITDKYVEVLPGRTLMGHESYPIVISKGSIV